jgi:tRNA threonylcarbamoyl adenosine modification protein (Sua5/YciO/YrdC/YwlC family)
MSPVLDAADPAARRAAAAAAEQGRLIVVPTDTVYGIAARLDRPVALASVFEAKARHPGMALPVLVADLDQARALALLDERAEALAGAFWPGGLTMVLPRHPSLTAAIGGDGTSVGIRVPDHPALALLLAETGPLATSSANTSGRPTPDGIDEIRGMFGDAVAVYLDGGPAYTPAGPPSTVVRLTDITPVLLRDGAVPFTKIMRVLGPAR